MVLGSSPVAVTSNFFDFEPPLYAIFLKNGATYTIDYTFGQISPFLLPLTRIPISLMKPNLKNLAILFALRAKLEIQRCTLDCIVK